MLIESYPVPLKHPEYAHANKYYTIKPIKCANNDFDLIEWIVALLIANKITPNYICT